MRADRQWRGERATNFFKCASITIPITGAASDKNYPPTKVDKGSGGELTTHCASVGEKASRVGSVRIGSGRVARGVEIGTRAVFKRELRDGRRRRGGRTV